MRVLFLGNSLTSWHNLPAYVAAFAKRSGDHSFHYRMIAPPAVGLEDHWRIQRTRRALAEERWDVVVMQQGPSAEPESRLHLCTWTKLPSLALHARDGLHPSKLGTYLAALVVYAGLRDVPPSRLPSSVVVSGKRFSVARRNAQICVQRRRKALAAPPAAPSCG